jgi:Homeobox KN domain
MKHKHIDTTGSLHLVGDGYQSSMSSLTSSSSSSSSRPIVGTTMSKHDFNHYMTQWLRDNFIYPYPDNDMVDDMASHTGRTKSTINNWLSNNRSRKWYHIMETVLQYKRPSDYFYEDCVNLFDGKPLRVLQVPIAPPHVPTATPAYKTTKAKTTKNASKSSIVIPTGCYNDDRLHIIECRNPVVSLEANCKGALLQNDIETDEWMDEVDINENLFDDIDIDDDDAFLSLIEKELETDRITDSMSPVYQHDDSMTMEPVQGLMTVSPFSQEKEEIPSVNVTIEWDTFYNESNLNLSTEDETSVLLLPSFDLESNSHLSFMEVDMST